MRKKSNPKEAASPKKPAGKANKAEKAPPGRKAFPVVGIGASAGGLEPLEAFFANVPSDKPPAVDLAFVVIQHLSPKHKSSIGEILKKDTDLPIQEIQDGMPLTPNTIYFKPPDQEVGIYQGVFHLVDPSGARYARTPLTSFSGPWPRTWKRRPSAFNTNMRKAGVNQSVIMKLTGHKTLIMFQRYNTVDLADAKEAYHKLEEMLRQGQEHQEKKCSHSAPEQIIR